MLHEEKRLVLLSTSQDGGNLLPVEGTLFFVNKILL